MFLFSFCFQITREQEYFRGVSFTTISAVGAHAALVHYSPSVQTNVPITRNEIYLVDSGGQYSDGTTDITRTIHLGEPKREEIEAFTRVLKGSILLSTAIFPPKAPVSYAQTCLHPSRQSLAWIIVHYVYICSFLSLTQWPVAICGTLAWIMAMEPGMALALFWMFMNILRFWIAAARSMECWRTCFHQTVIRNKCSDQICLILFALEFINGKYRRKQIFNVTLILIFRRTWILWSKGVRYPHWKRCASGASTRDKVYFRWDGRIEIVRHHDGPDSTKTNRFEYAE